jgi:hypothetical protein
MEGSEDQMFSKFRLCVPRRIRLEEFPVERPGKDWWVVEVCGKVLTKDRTAASPLQLFSKEDAVNFADWWNEKVESWLELMKIEETGKNYERSGGETTDVPSEERASTITPEQVEAALKRLKKIFQN